MASLLLQLLLGVEDVLQQNPPLGVTEGSLSLLFICMVGKFSALPMYCVAIFFFARGSWTNTGTCTLESYCYAKEISIDRGTSAL